MTSSPTWSRTFGYVNRHPKLTPCEEWSFGMGRKREGCFGSWVAKRRNAELSVSN